MAATGRDSRQRSTAKSTAVDSGHALFLSTFGRQWSTAVDRRMVDRGSTVVDSAVDRVDRVDRVDSQGSERGSAFTDPSLESS